MKSIICGVAQMIDHGIFNLKTAHQLFEKLRRDLRYVRDEPADSDGWFNFFVTADHLADWYCEGNEDNAKKMQQSHALLRVVHRLSINAKHYEQKPAKRGTIRLSPVANTHEAQSIFMESPPRVVGTEYVLELSPMEAEELGLPEHRLMPAYHLASQVVDFWAKQLNVPDARLRM
jgi:hypothetical protein